MSQQPPEEQRPGDDARRTSDGEERGQSASIKLASAGLVIGMLLHALSMTIVATALPTIVQDFGGLSQLPWVVTSYLLAATITVPVIGKISDFVGRRPLFQASIVVFVVGSLLCGVAQGMGQLIAARALQGIAGGGLMALSQAMIGDVVPRRQRGRYQGYIGAVFALASIAGPLAGGFLVDFVSWRAVFYLNVPLGAVAFVLTQRHAHVHHVRRRVTIDFLGSAILMAGTASLLLVGSWGGQQYAWNSPVILGLSTTALVCMALFVPVARRADEPVLPLALFRDRAVTAGAVLSFLFGMGLIGTVVFMPTFFQVVRGATATASGLALVPLMVANLVASIVSGRLITRWGHYRIFPVLGTALLVAGFGLLATLTPDATIAIAASYLIVVGVGIGFTLQVVVLAVQNSVDHADLGIATSMTQFSRMMGSTLGLAGFGAVVNLRFNALVADRLDSFQLLEGVDPERLASDPQMLAQFPAAVQDVVRMGLTEAVTGAFRLAIPILGIAFVMSLFIRNVSMDGPNSQPSRHVEGAQSARPCPDHEAEPTP